MSTIQTIIIIITLVIFFGRMFFGVFKRFSPFEHTESNDQVDFNVSDYNIVNPDANGNNTTDNEMNNRVGINSSSETENGTNGTVSSAEEGIGSPIRKSAIAALAKPNEMHEENANTETGKTPKSSTPVKTSAKQSVLFLNDFRRRFTCK